MPTIVPKTTIPRRSITAASSFWPARPCRAAHGEGTGAVERATLGRISADGTTASWAIHALEVETE